MGLHRGDNHFGENPRFNKLGKHPATQLQALLRNPFDGPLGLAEPSSCENIAMTCLGTLGAVAATRYPPLGLTHGIPRRLGGDLHGTEDLRRAAGVHLLLDGVEVFLGNG